jgi:hypothetical protein
MANENNERLWWWVSFFVAVFVVALCLWVAHGAVTSTTGNYSS